MIVFRSTINKAYDTIMDEIKLVDDKIHYHKNIIDTKKNLSESDKTYHYNEYLSFCKIKDGMTGTLLLFKSKLGD